jgi:hypothetical protein
MFGFAAADVKIRFDLNLQSETGVEPDFKMC